MIPALLLLSLVSDGFEHFYNLEYDHAIADFFKEIARKPQDPAGYVYLASALLYKEMFRSGVLASQLAAGIARPSMNTAPEDAAKIQDAIQRAMDVAQAILNEKPNDVHALYELGVAYGLRSNFNFLVRKAWIGALRDATKSRRLEDTVIRLDPGDMDAHLIPAIHEYVVGSLPFQYRFLGFLAGFNGDKAKGIADLRMVAEKGNFNKEDAQIFLSVIYRREKEPRLAIPLIDDLIRHFPRNTLLRFELAEMYSEAGDGKQALAVIADIEKLRADHAPGYARVPPEKIYYERATIQFWYRDLDHALDNLKRVTENAGALDPNTGALAWMRLGQIHDLKGQRPRAIEAYQHAIKFAPQSPGARESRRYLSTPYRKQ